MQTTQKQRVPQQFPGEFFSSDEGARDELIAGLGQKQAQISPKFLYNPLGAKLFEAICYLDEYYLTRAEAEIFQSFRPQIATAIGHGSTFIDLGAGNCAKAASLFSSLHPNQYVPIDISVELMQASVDKLKMEYPTISMFPIGMDFSQRFTLPAQVKQEHRVFFYPGSSLGNFTPLQAAQFLSRIRNNCRAGEGDAILIGIDLVKDKATLEAAYDDRLGVTAAFNLNILIHTNQILGADFNLAQWRHRALFNADQSRIEMHLQARDAATITWPGGQRTFKAGEYIHSENSYKYTASGIADLLSQSGFNNIQSWSDPENAFMVCYAQAN